MPRDALVDWELGGGSGEAREGWGVGGVECGTVREDWAWSFWWRRAGAKTVTLGGNKILTGINSPEQ
jgi:hypothetical protein